MKDNSRIRKFKLAIIEVLNASNLPAEVVRLVLVEILHEITTISEQAIADEMQEETEVKE